MNPDNNTPVKGDILVVDDDLPSLRTLSEMLTEEGVAEIKQREQKLQDAYNEIKDLKERLEQESLSG